MKKIVCSLILAAFIVVACNTGSKTNNFISKPDDIKADEYIVNIDRDTTLETKNGALLKIPKGSLSTDKGNTVTLEIKEAYSMRQMILAGLTTGSNGDPLSSGGMIYINVAEGQNATITRPIQVAIPADYLDVDMQLFKGENAKGNINWKEPVELPDNKQVNAVEQGQTLFQSKCASCHSIGKDMTAPDLAHFMKRFPFDKEGNEKYYLHGIEMDFKEYPEDFDERDDNRDTMVSSYNNDLVKSRREHFYPYYMYKCNLYHRFGTMAPYFNSNSDSGSTNNGWLLKIFRYIQNESDRHNLSLPSHAFLIDCVDSCNRYKQLTTELEKQKVDAQSKKQDLIEDNGPLVDKQPDSAMPVVNQPRPPDFDKKVSPENYDAGYYQFSITRFGWFNIDALLNYMKGVEESELFVRVTGDYRERIKIYLVIPTTKTFGEGGPADRNKEEFAFFYKTGKLPLPQGVKAYILAVTDSKDAPAFAIKEFTTRLSQTIEVSLQKATKEEFNNAMTDLHFDRLHINVTDAKNATEIRSTDANLEMIDKELKKAETLKPKNCDCDCGGEGL